MPLSDNADKSLLHITWVRSLVEINEAVEAGFQMLILDLRDLAMGANQGPEPAVWRLDDVPEVVAYCHAHWPHITLALQSDCPIHPTQDTLVNRLIHALNTPHLTTLFVADLGLAAYLRAKIPDCKLIYYPVSGNQNIASQFAHYKLFDGQVLSPEMPNDQIQESIAAIPTDFYILAQGRIVVHQSYRLYLSSCESQIIVPTDPKEAERSIGVLPPEWQLIDTPFGTLVQTSRPLDLMPHYDTLSTLGLRGILLDFRDCATGHGFKRVEDSSTHQAMWGGNSTDQAVRTVFRHTEDQFNTVGRVLDVIKGKCMVVETKSSISMTDSLTLITPEGRQVAMADYWMQNVGGVTISQAEPDQIVRFRFYKGAIPGAVICFNRSNT